MMNDPFSVEKADRELLILPRGAHGDRNWFADKHAPSAKQEDNFERFLDSEMVDVVRSLIG
jgi:hypothetical protein